MSYTSEYILGEGVISDIQASSTEVQMVRSRIANVNGVELMESLLLLSHCLHVR